LSRGHDLVDVLDLAVRLLFQYAQALLLIQSHQEKAQRMQILNHRRSS
jgi:hypothetical protein